jgi:hypothetical protein
MASQLDFAQLIDGPEEAGSEFLRRRNADGLAWRRVPAALNGRGDLERLHKPEVAAAA